MSIAGLAERALTCMIRRCPTGIAAVGSLHRIGSVILLVFSRWNVTARGMEPVFVVPQHPLHRGQGNVPHVMPGSFPVDQLFLVKTIHRLRRGHRAAWRGSCSGQAGSLEVAAARRHGGAGDPIAAVAEVWLSSGAACKPQDSCERPCQGPRRLPWSGTAACWPPGRLN